MKSMVRCRCVCKSWNSQFYNPDFLSHLNHHRSSSSSSSVSLNPKKRREDDYLILRNTCVQQSSSPYNHLHLSILSRKKLSETSIIIHNHHVPYNPLSLSVYEDIHLVGSINGLLCIAFHVEGNHQFVLWNPTIRFSKNISVPKHLCLDSVGWFGERCYPMMYGFGWDSVTDDYKLIAKPLNKNRVSPAAAGVYSCKTDCWSNINIVNYDQDWSSSKGEPPCVIVNGSPYWNYWKNTNNIVLKFDTSNNEFTYLKDPPPARNCDHFHKGTSLINLNDCLASVEYSGRWYAPYVYRL